MTTQELIVQKLAQLPESQVLSFVQELQTQAESPTPATQAAIDAEFLQIYASVAEDRKAVFQRLADS